MKVNCKFCGKPYTKTHNRQEYCSEYCRKEAKKEQNRNNFHRWYHRNKNQPIWKTKKILGSGELGPHMHHDHDKEYQAIQNEKKRLRIF